MSGFVVTAVFVLERGSAGGKLPLGPDLLGLPLGPGHRFSYCDGRTLTAVYELVADGEAAAFEIALSRIERAWESVGGGELPVPSTVRLQRAVPVELIVAGRPGGAPRRRRQKIGKVARQLQYFSAEQDGDPLIVLRDGPWIEGWEDDGPDDDGGLAGVREPRRPGPGPGLLSAEQPSPGPQPLPRTLQGPVPPGPGTPHSWTDPR